MTLAFRPSTQRQYQSMWTVWYAWCRSVGRTTSEAKEEKVSDFLIYLGKKRKVCPPRLKSYKSVLTMIYAFKGQDFSSSRSLHMVIRGFEQKDLKKCVTPLNWDLDIVLRHLKGSDYEPLEQASFRHLTKKTLFLVALATAKRVGELQALSQSVSFSGSDAFLQYVPEFVAKTSTIEHPVPRDFRLKAISSAPGHKPSDLKLCPVRALRIYQSELKKRPPRCRNLFVQLRKNHKPISKNGLSYLLRQTIQEAHQSQPDADYPIGRVKAHSIRAAATSVNFMKNRSLSSVMEAATWRGNSTFASHYLKEVQRFYDNCRSLDLIIAGSAKV